MIENTEIENQFSNPELAEQEFAGVEISDIEKETGTEEIIESDKVSRRSKIEEEIYIYIIINLLFLF